MAREKTMYVESEPRFHALRSKMELEWVPAMRHLIAIDNSSLPVLWDADFLYGPKTARGEDTYVLCEINVSAVLPFPETAVERIAQAAVTRMLAAKKERDTNTRKVTAEAYPTPGRDSPPIGSPETSTRNKAE